MLLIALIAFLVYLGFILWLESGLSKSLKTTGLPGTAEANLQKISVIIAAHNEEANIRKTLEAILSQNFPADSYEVIVAADRCTDKTVDIVREFAVAHRHLHLIEIEEPPAGLAPKKHALQQGISQSRYPVLLMLDADCIPGPNLLSTFSRHFAAGADAVLGIPKIRWQPAAAHCYLRPERLTVWGTAAAAVGHETPFLAFGGIWGYTKASFERIGGFGKISQSLSGDDDLLVQRMSAAGLKVIMNWDPAGWVTTDAPTRWQDLYYQRRRHHSAGRHYPKSLQAAYALFHLSELLLYLAPLFLPPAIIFFAGKWFLDWLALKRLAALFREPLGFRHLLCYQLGALIHHGIIGPISQWGKPKWKAEKKVGIN